jgi:hypothetical protein
MTSTHFQCFQCQKKCNESTEPVYRTFADSFGDTIGRKYYRLCQACCRQNKRDRWKAFLFMILVLVALWIHSHYFK